MKTPIYIASCLLLLTITAANPYSAQYNPGPDQLFWFLSISDTHIENKLEGGNQPVDNLNWATSELLETVQPQFMVLTGDITEGKDGGLIPTGQSDAEWQNYRAIVDSNGMSPDSYFDMPGNHDQYNEADLNHYLEYSVLGQATGAINHAWTREDTAGKTLFIALATCGSDGAPWPVDNGGLDNDDMAFLQTTLNAHQDADIIVLFGHHPAQANYYWSDGLQQFQQIMEDWDVSAYIFGHSHEYSMQWSFGTLQVNVASLGKSAHHQVGLYAFDGRGLAAKVFDAGDWPQVLLTAPLDSNLAGAHLHDYMVPQSMPAAPIRALAFHPDGVEQVTAAIDDGPAFDLELLEDNIWQGTFDPSGLDEYPHKLTIIAYAAGAIDLQNATFYVFPEPVPPIDESLQDMVEYAEPADDILEQDSLPEAPFEVVTQPEPATDMYVPDLATDSQVDLDFDGFAELMEDWQEEVDAPLPVDQGTPATGYLPVDSDGCAHNQRGPSGSSGLILLLMIGLSLLVACRRQAE
jgi:hypothetical protein